MSRQRRAGVAIREHAAELVRLAADEREETGDPEGAQVLRDLVRDIRKIPLTEER